MIYLNKDCRTFFHLRKHTQIDLKIKFVSYFLKWTVIEWRMNINELTLIISLASSGALIPNLGCTPSIHGKFCYFIKKHAKQLNPNEIQSV